MHGRLWVYVYIFNNISEFLHAPLAKTTRNCSLWIIFSMRIRCFKMRGGSETCIHSPPWCCLIETWQRVACWTVERSMFCIHISYAAGNSPALGRKREPRWLRCHRPSLGVNLGSWEQLKQSCELVLDDSMML